MEVTVGWEMPFSTPIAWKCIFCPDEWAGMKIKRIDRYFLSIELDSLLVWQQK